VVTVLAGLREPIVVVLLLIAFFTSISGKPLDGLLMLVAGVSLAWDAGRRSRRGGPLEADRAESRAGDSGQAESREAGDRSAPEVAVAGAPVPGMPVPGMPVPGMPGAAGAAPARWRRPLLILPWLAGGALYVFVVGSFSRYSWPATVAVVALGVTVVVTGWRGPRHPRSTQAKLPAAGLALWGLVLVAGCLWELLSLLEQPTLTTSSYAHPTISTLTDPVLGSWAGRSAVLAGWLGLGWFLVER
jgi:hypothetical protein